MALRRFPLLLLLAPLLLPACDREVNYHEDVKPILDANCVTCHQPGEIGLFSLTDYSDAYDMRHLIVKSVRDRVMPPWGPSASCRDYKHDRSLSPEETSTLADWIDQGALPGVIDLQAVEPAPAEPMFFDLEVTFDEPYTPQTVPDDYRCLIVDWPMDQQGYITGFGLEPDQRALVHHAIAFMGRPEAVEGLRALDAAEPGPGYSCFGAPSPDGADGILGLGYDLDWIASWAPGRSGMSFPEGTGVLVEPGSVLVLQMHYNSLTEEPAADLSTFGFQVALDVERPAVVMPFVNIGWVFGAEPMTIPAGEKDVVHTTEVDLSGFYLDWFGAGIGLGSGESIALHQVSMHMHNLGTEGRLSVYREGDSEADECLLELPRWDFDWQDNYQLTEEVIVNPGDLMRLECHWDNSDENQPVIEGIRATAQDVSWGEGTQDEMCLGILYITGLAETD